MIQVNKYWAVRRGLQLSSRCFHHPRQLHPPLCAHHDNATRRFYDALCVSHCYATLSRYGARKLFSSTCSVGRSSQAAQIACNEQAATTDDNVRQQKTSYTTTSHPIADSATLACHPTTSGRSDTVPAQQIKRSSINAIRNTGSRTGTFKRVDHSYEALQGDSLGLDVSDFATSSGFSSLHKFEAALNDPAGVVSTTVSIDNGMWKTAVLDAELKSHAVKSVSLQDLWPGHEKHGKIDLSTWHPVRGEREGSYHSKRLSQRQSQSLPLPSISKSVSHLPAGRTAHLPLNFRSNRGDRRVVLHFMTRVYPHISGKDGITDEAIRVLLNDPIFANVARDMNALTDILRWSWILTAPTDIRFKRLLSVVEASGNRKQPELPLWVVMQLLRSDHCSAQDFVSLNRFIHGMIDWWTWLGDNPMTLTVRLLRYARISHPESIASTVEYFLLLLHRRFPSNPHSDDLRKLVHWCNRLLSLLSLPTAMNPFRHVTTQQDAQLLLLRYMKNANPEIPLTREGYRALAELQLMHKRTVDERSWAQVQASTWPPWEKQHQMGVTSTRQSLPGSISRTNKVLFRMREDGYSPHDVDTATQILAGKDSDQSPTLQVRRQSSVICPQTPWLLGTDSDSATSPRIWAARITATRTLREAWMGFCAYESVCKDTQPSRLVYLAMFQKFWVRTLSTPSENSALPGEGVENFPDPALTRDRVYVPEDVPSMDSFYDRMIARGVKPYGDLLSGLVLYERRLHRGLLYIKDSDIPLATRALLANPMSHSPPDVAKALQQCSRKLIMGYILLLARPHAPRDTSIPRYRSIGLPASITGPVFVAQVLLNLTGRTDVYWGRLLRALRLHGEPAESEHLRTDLECVWQLIGDIRAGMVGNQRFSPPSTNPMLFDGLLPTAFRIQTWIRLVDRVLRHDPLEVSIKCFIELVSGSRPTWVNSHDQEWSRFVRNQCEEHADLHFVPKADAIQDLALLMVATQHSNTINDILHLLRWTLCYHREISAISSITKRNLAAFRVYLEGQWATRDREFLALHPQILIADEPQIQEARTICEQLGGWASDDDVEAYLISSEPQFTRVKNKLKACLISSVLGTQMTENIH